MNAVILSSVGEFKGDMLPLVDRLRRVSFHGRHEYSQTARTLADECEQLIDGGQAARTVPVLRKAVDRMTRALTHTDDSSGMIGNDLHHIMSLYARACAAAPPKPAGLAKWLVGLSFDGPGWPHVQLGDFAAALGDPGLAEVARLVEERARTVDPESWTAMHSVRDLREQLAEVSGNLDRYVAVLAEHLDSAIQYERITHALRDADRRQDAITWARKGLAAKPGSPHTTQLGDALVDMLLAEGRPAEAVQARRDEYARHPTAAAYRALAAVSAQAEAEDPTPWALKTLTERVVRQPVFAAELLDVLDILGRHDEAWRLAQDHRAVLGGPQWLHILDRRGVEHPNDVLIPYQDLIEHHVLNSTDKQRYRKAVALLPTLRDAYLRAGDHPAFVSYLEALRARHTRRPTFLKTLDTTTL